MSPADLPKPEQAPTDALAENLGRIPAAPPVAAPPASLAGRLRSLAAELAGSPDTPVASPTGLDRTPPDACYNDATSGGEAGAPDLGASSAGPSRKNARSAAPERDDPHAGDEGDSMSLQACTKCGAQFDVSSFSPGQQFTCGACGTVLTAGGQAAPAAPARRTPGGSQAGSSKAGSAPAAPSRRTPGGKAPASGRGPRKSAGGPRKVVSGGPGAPSKGPQYQPVQRGGAPAGAGAGTPGRKKSAPVGRAPSSSAPTSRAPQGGARRGARRGADEDGGRPVRGSSGPNKGLLIGVGVVIVALVAGLIAMGGGDKKPTEGGGNMTAGGGSSGAGGTAKAPVDLAPTETAKDVMAEYVTERPTMLRQYRKFISRLTAIEGEAAQNALRTVYEDFIEGPGRDDKEARAFLGYMDFPHEVPEDISFRRYPYLTAVEAAYNRRWFAPDEKEEYETAMKAWKETLEHKEKLVNDHRFRAADQIRANISRDKNFKDYNYAARWSDPHLICYASKDRISEYDLLSITDKEERKAKRASILAKQKEFEQVLDEKQAIFSGLYKFFMDEYKEPLNLKPLMDEWGGRPDYPGNVRSYRDGAPVVVWIFDSRAAFDEYHQKVAKEMIPHNVAGYFSPQSTYVFLYDEGDKSSNRTFEINKNVHEGMHQLEFWFTRQRNRWSKPLPGQDFFGEGIAEYIGAVQLQPDHTLKFLGVNVPRLKNMQDLAKGLDKRGGKYELFPVDKLVGFTSYGEVQNWGSQAWGLSRDMVLGMFYQQSWAFVYFMNQYKNGKYKDKFLTYFNLVLHKETGGNEGDAAFREAFRIRDEDDWEDINDEFHEYVRDVLMKLDTSKYEYTPPPRGEKAK
jgi:hypothetical protein